MNTWAQLMKEFKELKARVDALENKTHIPVQKPQIEPSSDIITTYQETPARKPGRPKKVIEGEDVV